MSFVNINPVYYFNDDEMKESYSIRGKLKSCCDDFEVKEIPRPLPSSSSSSSSELLLIPVDLHNFAFIHSSNVEILSTATVEKNKEISNENENKNEISSAPPFFDAKVHIGDSTWQKLVDLNSSFFETRDSNNDGGEDKTHICSDKDAERTCEREESFVIIPSSPVASERAALYNIIKESFCFLTCLSSSSKTTDVLPSPPVIRVEIDNTFVCLLPLLSSQNRTGLPKGDVESLYSFLKAGPSHAAARQGIRIGHGLGREERTDVYRKITNSFRSFDSKTVDAIGVLDNDDNGNNYSRSVNNKVMLIYWKEKSLKRGRSASQTSSSSFTSDSFNNDVVHLAFVLFKRGVEQTYAKSLICKSCFGVTPSDITIAGTKDKQAVTYQLMCITLRLKESRSDNKRSKMEENGNRLHPLAQKVQDVTQSL